MEASVAAVERLISYSFRDKKLLEDALTHPSYAHSSSYQRLEYIGDSAIGHLINDYYFFDFPHLDEGQISSLKAANVSTEKLARVAVRHGLYQFLRHSAPALDHQVREFVDAVGQEENLVPYGGLVQAPKVLADIVESVVGAIYVDVNRDFERLWLIIRGLLEPIYTPEDLLIEPQPVTVLYQVCQRNGMQVDIKNWRNGSKNVASVYVDGSFVASGSSKQKQIARLDAAREALMKLSKVMDISSKTAITIDGIDKSFEIEGAKQKLHDFLCQEEVAETNIQYRPRFRAFT